MLLVTSAELQFPLMVDWSCLKAHVTLCNLDFCFNNCRYIVRVGYSRKKRNTLECSMTMALRNRGHCCFPQFYLQIYLMNRIPTSFRCGCLWCNGSIRSFTNCLVRVRFPSSTRPISSPALHRAGLLFVYPDPRLETSPQLPFQLMADWSCRNGQDRQNLTTLIAPTTKEDTYGRMSVWILNGSREELQRHSQCC